MPDPFDDYPDLDPSDHGAGSSPTIYTIGHSTRALDDFVGMLKAHGVRKLVDVRTIPRSRRHPHFSGEELAESLLGYGVEYRWCKALGGLRRPLKDSLNTAWRNESFRGYADYMQTPAFQAAVEELLELGRNSDTVIMCAEAVPWRCHRSLIGDALLARGARVVDIMSEKKASVHRPTPFARFDGVRVNYPARAE